MSEKANLKILHCPTCGANLKAENNTDAIVCVYCGNTVVPTGQAGGKEVPSHAEGFLRVEGIKTSSSALAYMEQFFEAYDWDSFAYAQNLSISELDDLADSLRVSSADDKNTWLVCFRAISVPFSRKAAGCRQILQESIEEYQQNDLDAYSKFDAYKRIAEMITLHKSGILATLKKYADLAVRYGAAPAETNCLYEEIHNLNAEPLPEIFSSLDAVPQIQRFVAEKNARIVQELAAKGIDAPTAYLTAKTLTAEKRYAEALHILRSLEGYSDANALAKNLDKYFRIGDVLELEDTLYIYEKGESEQAPLQLYPIKDGKRAPKPLITNMSCLLTNYADTLYYVNQNQMLTKCTLSTGQRQQLHDKAIRKNTAFAYDRKVFLQSVQHADYDETRYTLLQLDTSSGELSVLLPQVASLVGMHGSKLVYTIKIKSDGEEEHKAKVLTHVIDVQTKACICLGDQPVEVQGVIDDCVVYTQKAPNDYNLNLFCKSMQDGTAEVLVEQNIYRFCSIFAGKLFFYVGNHSNQTLICKNPDGTGRKEFPLYISQVLFEQGGWLYFTRKVGYNAILCKSRLDGSNFRIIAADIDSFVEIKNGYLYYINDASALVKVRMDGSNLQTLCQEVASVLSVQENKILFISMDDRIQPKDLEVSTSIPVKSIYTVDFSGSGKQKLAYNIQEAKAYDENTVYYLANDKKQTVLYKLDVTTNRTEKLLQLQKAEEEKGGCYVATAVYGSYDCPQVWTLRRFRDNTLASTWFGRLFIRTYYAVSPLLVRWFGHQQWFRKLWRGPLDRMVAGLQAKGVESTPYQDRKW